MKGFGRSLVTFRIVAASFLPLQEMAAFSGALIGTLHVGINFYPCSPAAVECRSPPCHDERAKLTEPRYSESIALLYTMNTLLLKDYRTFLLLPKAIAPHRLRSLRFLYLQINVFRGNTIDCDIQSSWLKICTTLAGMDRLEDLCIALGAHPRGQHAPASLSSARLTHAPEESEGHKVSCFNTPRM